MRLFPLAILLLAAAYTGVEPDPLSPLGPSASRCVSSIFPATLRPHTPPLRGDDDRGAGRFDLCARLGRLPSLS